MTSAVTDTSPWRRQSHKIAPYNVVTPGPVEDIRQVLLQNGLLAVVTGSNLRIQPPLSIAETQLREGIALIDGALCLADAAALAG